MVRVLSIQRFRLIGADVAKTQMSAMDADKYQKETACKSGTEDAHRILPAVPIDVIMYDDVLTLRLN